MSEESEATKEAKERIYRRLLKWIREHPLTEENLRGLSNQESSDLIENSRRLLAEEDEER